MAKWYIKEFGKMTGVSTRALHHYDKIDLLKPSARLENGYRVYTEKDLLILQQIIALKFFGFQLSEIKKIIERKVDIISHFSMQSTLLKKQANTLLETSKTLDVIINDCKNNKSIAWQKIIELIEVYNMKQNLENKWVANILENDDLKTYAEFEKELKKTSAQGDKERYQEEWRKIAEEIEKNLDINPASEFGMELGKKCMAWVNKLYGKKYAGLRRKIWEKGFKKGKTGGAHSLSPEAVDWLDKALDEYWRKRIHAVLAKLSTHPSDEVLREWNKILEDMYGYDQEPKDELYRAVMENKETDQTTKNLLTELLNMKL